jgi:hypothetical protein
MAIYHQSIKPVQRSAGKSAVAAAAYRSRSTLHDVRQSMTFSYTAKQDLVHAEIVGFAGDRGTLWNMAEAMETRKDATVAREYEVALPVELDTAEQIELLREFAQWLNKEYECVVDFAFHSGDGKNPHGHMLTTTRSVDAYGTMSGIKISREWSDKKRKANGLPGRKSEVKKAREMWAEMANAALDRAGIDVRIDHRSYADQGIDRLPTSHIGPAATAMERDGIQTRVGDHNRMIGQINLERQFELDDLRKRQANVDALAQQLAEIDEHIESIREESVPKPTTLGTIIQSGYSESIAVVAERESAHYSQGMAKTIGEQYKSRLFRSTWNADIDPKLLKSLKWVDVESRALTLKTGEQIQDQGDKVSLSKGSDDGISLAISMAKAKDWKSVTVSGSDDFQVRAALALRDAGIEPALSSEIAKARFSDKLRERAKSVAQKPEPAPKPKPEPGIDIESLKSQVRSAFSASPLDPIRFSQDDPVRLKRWVRSRWDELTKNGKPEGFTEVFRELAEEQAYLAGYSVQSVQSVGIDAELSKVMPGYKQPKPLPSVPSDKPLPAPGQRRTWYPDSDQKSP